MGSAAAWGAPVDKFPSMSLHYLDIRLMHTYMDVNQRTHLMLGMTAIATKGACYYTEEVCYDEDSKRVHQPCS